jgi:hypothetical protein
MPSSGAGAAVWDLDPEALGSVVARFDRGGAGHPGLLVPPLCQDGGRFRADDEDLGIKDGNNLGERKAGFLPYLVLVGGIAVVLIAKWIVG